MAMEIVDLPIVHGRSFHIFCKGLREGRLSQPVAIPALSLPPVFWCDMFSHPTPGGYRKIQDIVENCLIGGVTPSEKYESQLG